MYLCTTIRSIGQAGSSVVRSGSLSQSPQCIVGRHEYYKAVYALYRLLNEAGDVFTTDSTRVVIQADVCSGDSSKVDKGAWRALVWQGGSLSHPR